MSPASTTAASASASADPATYIISTDELPAGAQTWTQTMDGPLNNQPGTHQRVWETSDQSEGLEVDVVVEPSVAAATADWSTWSSTIQANITPSSQPSCPNALPTTCTESVGSTSDKDEVRISWQDGSVLAAVVLGQNATNAGAVDQAYAESVAAAEDQKIVTAQGSG